MGVKFTVIGTGHRKKRQNPLEGTCKLPRAWGFWKALKKINFAHPGMLEPKFPVVLNSPKKSGWSQLAHLQIDEPLAVGPVSAHAAGPQKKDTW